MAKTISNFNALPGMSFTRSSSGTSVGLGGNIENNATNAPRIDHDPVTGRRKGLMFELAATNLFLNSDSPTTQSISVTSQEYSLSFYGTGTITLSGASSAGPLVGAGENSKVEMQFTPSSGSLTLTLSGDVRHPQLEVGEASTSYIPTAGSSATRARDNMTYMPLGFEYSEDKGTFVVDFEISKSAGTTNRLIEFTNAGLDNRYSIRLSSQDRMQFYSRSTSATNFDITFPNNEGGIIPKNQKCRAVMSYSNSQVHTCWNGKEVETRSVGGPPSGMDRINFGYENTILNIQYIPESLTAEQVKELSRV